MANPTQTQGAAAPSPLSPPAHGGINFKAVLQEMIRRNGSDLHLKVGRPPTIRVDGALEAINHPPLKPEDLKSLAEQQPGALPNAGGFAKYLIFASYARRF